MSSGLDEVLRVEGGRVLATLIRMTGDFGVAEDAVQEATLEALAKWESDMPKNPAAWLTTVAKRKALDRLRRESQRTDRETESVRLLDQTTEPDDGVGTLIGPPLDQRHLVIDLVDQRRADEARCIGIGD